MIYIKDLTITQHNIRSYSHLHSMVDFARNGGFFTQDIIDNYVFRNLNHSKQRLIQISKFEDGRMYITDGHHRALAIYLSGNRDFIDSPEYDLNTWRYEHFKEINPESGWVTPFDPRVEVRLPELSVFRGEIKAKENNYEKIKYIVNSERLFKETRMIWSVSELADSVSFEALLKSIVKYAVAP